MSLPSYNNRYDAAGLWGTYPLILNGSFQMPIPRNGNYDVGRDYISTSNSKRANTVGALMHKKTLAKKTLVTVKYQELEASKWSQLYAQIEPNDNQEFVTLTYFDPYLNQVVQNKTFYVPATTTTVQYVRHKGNSTEAYVDVTIEFIEQ